MSDSEGGKDAVALGGSAGSLDVLLHVLSQLPPDYELAVMVVVHQFRHGGRRLAEVLASRSRVPVRSIEDKDPIEPQRVHVCPANYHVLVERGRTFGLSTDPPVNFARPSIDLLFQSAAQVYRDRLVGVLLSGSSSDGALGLAAIRAWGGVAACQDPETAAEPTMPRAGRQATRVDWTGSPAVIAEKLSELRR